jgi:succinate dehydrogenase / fumarate reductase iron-sulfur subunit
MDIKLKILRYNPETDRRGHWEEYSLEADPDERILDLLHKVKWFDDGSLAFRRSCAHGVCGSDAMVVNGENMLACQVLVKEVSNPIKIEPIRGLPVIKDLVVNMDSFFESYKKVMPYLVNDEEPGERERLSLLMIKSVLKILQNASFVQHAQQVVLYFGRLIRI